MAERLAQTAIGAVRGIDRGDHTAFLGVPYAAAPVGDRRFAAPETAAAWSGIRDATAIAPCAPQDPLVPPPYRATHTESEDCLYLDVYTPAADDARRPVFFWIHGGGFSHGSGSQPTYDGGPLATRGDVVVVDINYRLGALGYLFLDELGGPAWSAAANAGQLDQIAALRWVHHSIAAFGGDPDNVTIVGQSAGAVAVCTLLAMPEARPYFAKAIAQSGTANVLPDAERATADSAAYLERLGIPDADPRALRSTPVARFLEVQGPRGLLRPAVDGASLPVRPIDAVRDGFAADVPLLIGTVRDEHKLYVVGRKGEIDDDRLLAQVISHLPRRARDRAAEVVDVYRASRTARDLPATNHDLVDAVATTSRFRMPALRLAESQARHQAATFVYQVDWTSPARGGSLGACHGIEVPFVFGTIGRNGNERMAGTGVDAERLSHQMMDAWIAFARTGRPGHDGIGSWPAYDTERRPTMVFDRSTGIQDAPFDEERALWTSMLARPAPDPAGR